MNQCPGHWWCDKCDEPAFGSLCQHCHHPARFIPDDPPRLNRSEIKPRQPHAAQPVSAERGHELFAQLRHKLNLL